MRSPASPATVDVIVLTSDASLLATLREAAGAAHRFFPADTISAAVDSLVGGRCGIFVIDVGIVGNELARLTEKLQAQFPEVILLATGHRNEQNSIAQLVANGRIYRFLHKPVSPARAELFLSAATRRYAEIRQQESRTAGAVRRLATPGTRNVLLGIVGAVVAAGVWIYVEQAATDESMRTVEAAPTVVDATQRLADTLALAEASFRDGRLFPPAENNAFELYNAVLGIEPDSPQARAALAQIVATAERNAMAAAKAQDQTRMSDAVATLARVAPNHASLATYRRQLAGFSRPARSVVLPPAVAPSDAPSTTVAPSLPSTSVRTQHIDIARAYLTANQLVEPIDGNAFSQLLQARVAGEDSSRLQITATDLGTRLLNRAIAAVNANDVIEARRALDAAANVDREFETSLPELDSVAARVRDLESASQRVNALADQLARVTRLRSAGQLIEPPGENAYELLKEMLSRNVSSAELRTEQQRLSFALLENVRTALAAGDIDRADVLATRAEEIQPGLTQTRALREQIGAARAERDDRNAVVQAANLPRRRNVPAIYPREALLNRVEGWVDLEFVIGPEGVPTDIEVRAAQPARVFDNAATQALKQWRFEPIVRDGAPQARRATLRMEFKLKD